MDAPDPEEFSLLDPQLYEDDTRVCRFPDLTGAIYTILTRPEQCLMANKKINEAIEEDLLNGECIFHHLKKLEPINLTNEEIRLAALADIAGEYEKHMDLDGDSNGEFTRTDEEGGTYSLMPGFSEKISDYPRIAQKYPFLGLDLRGQRTPIYDALEQYHEDMHLKAAKTGEDPPPGNVIMNQAIRTMAAIREKLFQKATEYYRAGGDYSYTQDMRARQFADEYLLLALDTHCISRSGNPETVKDLLHRMAGKQAYEEAVQQAAPSSPLSSLFWSQLKSAKEPERGRR